MITFEKINLNDMSTGPSRRSGARLLLAILFFPLFLILIYQEQAMRL